MKTYSASEYEEFSLRREFLCFCTSRAWCAHRAVVLWFVKDSKCTQEFKISKVQCAHKTKELHYAKDSVYTEIFIDSVYEEFSL